LVDKFKEHIDAHFSFLKGKKLLIACSGGLDSAVLTHLSAALDFEFALAHCNFSLRGKDSDTDEMFVVGLAKKMDVPVFAETFDTVKYADKNHLSIQLAARELRYNWFEALLKNFKYDYVLTGHHLDDDLETFLINFSRGTGLRGLTGIPVQNEKIVRPLLAFSRKDLMDWATSENIQWREDSTNQESEYLRNKIRLEVVPPLKEANSSLLKNFQTTQRNLKAAENLVEDYMALIYNLAVTESEGVHHIDVQKLKDLPNTEELLYELLNNFGFTEWNDVVDLMDAQTGKQLFSKTHRLLKNRDELLLMEITSEEDAVVAVPEQGIESPIQLKIERVDKMEQAADEIIYVDYDRLQFPLTLRKKRAGDVFYPFGMKGKKKLSKYFKDEKFSIFEKENTWLLCSGDEIVWVVNHRMDSRFKVDAETKNIGRITSSD